MAKRYETYDQLATETLQGLMANQNNWTGFLDTASRMYKYTFDEQVLIFAQRPETKACASFDFWTSPTKMNLHVRKGTDSIALVDRDRKKLYYVYAMEDTEARQNGKSRNPEQFIWRLEPEKVEKVNQILCKNGGIISGNIEETIVRMAYAACSNQLAAYEEEFTMLYQKTAPGMQKEAMWAAFTETLAQSAAYMALQRCGLDAGICRFKHLQQFGMEFTALMGKGTGDTARVVLRTIEQAVHQYNKLERSNLHEQRESAEGENQKRNSIHSGREDTDVPPGLRGGRGGSDSREIRTDARAVPEGALRSDLLHDAAPEHADRPSAGDGRKGVENAGRNHRSDGGTRRYRRESENEQSGEMGRLDEQLLGSSRGTHSEGTDSRPTVNNHTESTAGAMEQHAPAVSVSEGNFADRVYAAFAAIAIDRSFTDKQQQFLNRLAKFAIQTHTTVDLIHTAFEESRLFKNTYGGVKWLSKNLFAGRVQSLERELNTALEKQLTQAIHVQEQELPTQSDTHEQQIESEKQSNKQSSPTVDDLTVGDIILYDGKRREVEQIDENRISLKDLDAPDFGGILLGTSDVYAYNGWQDDMNAKGFEILSKTEPAAKTEPEPEKEQPAVEKPEPVRAEVTADKPAVAPEAKKTDVSTFKNLSQLKKALKPGMMFEISDHLRPECIGECRVITGVSTVDFTSRRLDENGEPMGKDLHMNFDRAKNWSFDGNELTSHLEDGSVLMSFHFIDGMELTREPERILFSEEETNKLDEKVDISSNFSESQSDAANDIQAEKSKGNTAQ